LKPKLGASNSFLSFYISSLEGIVVGNFNEVRHEGYVSHIIDSPPSWVSYPQHGEIFLVGEEISPLPYLLEFYAMVSSPIFMTLTPFSLSRLARLVILFTLRFGWLQW